MCVWSGVVFHVGSSFVPCMQLHVVVCCGVGAVVRGKV
jgi:hypothetical protein